MEEAEVLCDRLGIFVDGQFQCIGNPKEVRPCLLCMIWHMQSIRWKEESCIRKSRLLSIEILPCRHNPRVSVIVHSFTGLLCIFRPVLCSKRLGGILRPPHDVLNV
jgi:hypothetical protein